jgi:hypothetical protein
VIRWLPLGATKPTFKSGTQIQFRKIAFINSISLDKLWILLGKMIANLQPQAVMTFIFGPSTSQKSRNKFGKGITLVLKVSNGIKKAIFLQVLQRTTTKSSFGRQNQGSIF